MHFFGYLPVCHEVKNLEAFQPVKDLIYAITIFFFFFINVNVFFVPLQS